jgi:predicted 2-oxoglutarate/Fe(II)-dependent dioxygenase YbiX
MIFRDESVELDSLPFADPSNIVIKENFISKDHLAEILEYCHSIEFWESRSQLGTDSIHMPEFIEKNSPYIFSIMQQYVDKVQHEVEYRFGRFLERTKPGIRKWYPGEKQDVHADGETADGWPGYNYIVDYGSIIYLNDEYEGGELFFPKYNIHIKPEPGTLVFFPSTNMYAHGVTEVTDGIRYTSPHFWIPVKHRVLMEMAVMDEQK